MTKPRLLSAQPGENVIIATWENPEDNFEGTELKYKKVWDYFFFSSLTVFKSFSIPLLDKLLEQNAAFDSVLVGIQT